MKMNIKKVIAGTLLCATSTVFADAQTAQEISAKLTPALGAGLFVKQLNNLNIYTVAKGDNIFFTDSSASFLMRGDIVDVESQIIISDVAKSEIENARRMSNAQKKSKLNNLSDFGKQNNTTKNVTTSNASNKDLKVPFESGESVMSINAEPSKKAFSKPTKSAPVKDEHSSIVAGGSMTEETLSRITAIESMEPSELEFGAKDFATACLQIAGNSSDIKDLYGNFREMNPKASSECGLVFGGFKLPREDDNDMIVYKAENEKRFITVISDFTCHFCGLLHNEVEELNEMGVTVKVWPYGRAPYLDAKNEYTMTAKNMVMATCQADNEKRKELYDMMIENPHKYAKIAIADEDSVNNECANRVLSNKIYGEIFTQGRTPVFMMDDGSTNIGYLKASRIGKLLNL